MSVAEEELLNDDELPSLLEAITEHDQQAAELQQESSRLPEALVILERALVLRTRAFGVQSEQVITACKSLAELCNLQAIGDLARGEFKSALELLKKAQILTDQHPLVRAVTFNNFACYYRRTGKLQKALEYAEKALRLESDETRHLPFYLNSSDTYLNQCAILSELGRHEHALIAAQNGIRLLLHEFALNEQADPDTLLINEAALNDCPFGEEEAFEDMDDQGQVHVQPARTGPSPDRWTVFGIAYHNMGVEHEFLLDGPASLASYEQAHKIGQVILRRSGMQPVVRTLQSSYETALKKRQSRTKSRVGRATTAGAAKVPTPSLRPIASVTKLSTPAAPLSAAAAAKFAAYGVTSAAANDFSGPISGQSRSAPNSSRRPATQETRGRPPPQFKNSTSGAAAPRKTDAAASSRLADVRDSHEAMVEQARARLDAFHQSPAEFERMYGQQRRDRSPPRSHPTTAPNKSSASLQPYRVNNPHFPGKPAQRAPHVPAVPDQDLYRLQQQRQAEEEELRQQQLQMEQQADEQLRQFYELQQYQADIEKKRPRRHVPTSTHGQRLRAPPPAGVGRFHAQSYLVADEENFGPVPCADDFDPAVIPEEDELEDDRSPLRSPANRLTRPGAAGLTRSPMAKRSPTSASDARPSSSRGVSPQQQQQQQQQPQQQFSFDSHTPQVMSLDDDYDQEFDH